MCILDTNLKKEAIVYAIVTIACIIFSFIYLKLSFGVISLYMKYAFLIPLVLGVGIYTLLTFFSKLNVNRLSINLYNAGIATFLFGCIIRGILDICGAHSFFLWIYIAIGALEVIASIIVTIVHNIKTYKVKKY